MKQISQKELKEKYGIELSKGLYKINTLADKYQINTVQDDTLGCVLVGQNKAVGKVLNSRVTMNALMEKLKGQDDIEITIE